MSDDEYVTVTLPRSYFEDMLYGLSCIQSDYSTCQAEDDEVQVIIDALNKELDNE